MLRYIAPLLLIGALATAQDLQAFALPAVDGVGPGDRVDLIITELDAEGFLERRILLGGVEVGALLEPGAVMLVLDAYQTRVVCELPPGALLQVVRVDEPVEPARQISLYDVSWSPDPPGAPPVER